MALAFALAIDQSGKVKRIVVLQRFREQDDRIDAASFRHKQESVQGA